MNPVYGPCSRCGNIGPLYRYDGKYTFNFYYACGKCIGNQESGNSFQSIEIRPTSQEESLPCPWESEKKNIKEKNTNDQLTSFQELDATLAEVDNEINRLEQAKPTTLLGINRLCEEICILKSRREDIRESIDNLKRAIRESRKTNKCLDFDK
jgi:hypothetical protein